MASAELRDELDCSICLTTYTDPVMLRCGHNFCRLCIDRVLDTQDGSRGYSCPECREEFQERPALMRNLALRKIMENLLTTQPTPRGTGIFCSYCVDSPVPAVRSCLHCEASLCDKHLRVHSKGPEHVLTDPSTSLENRKCSVHKKILEYYCIEDAACICVSCRLDGEHNGHKMESLDEASLQKKKKQRNVLQKLITKREKTEERVQSLKEQRRKTQEKASGEAERVTALFIDIRRRQDDLEKRILSEISRQEKEKTLSLSALIQKLEIQKDELSRKMRHMEELCNMTDPLTVLQEPDTGDLCDPEEGGGDEDTGGHDKQRHDVDDLDVTVISDTLHTLYDIISGIRSGIYEEDPAEILLDVNTAHNNLHISDTSHTLCDVISGIGSGIYEVDPAEILLDVNTAHNNLHISDTSHTLCDVISGIGSGIYEVDPAEILLNVNTAHNNLHISDDLKTATWTREKQKRPETAERFQYYPQVMSSRRFTSGRHYWDVEISRSEEWSVGMCYPSIDRRGGQSAIGNNNKSWMLWRWYNNQYYVTHGSNKIQLPYQISSDRFRICVDYEAGELSFYELCDPLRHLHTFTATFTEPLNAALWVGEGSTKILGGGRNWEKPQ